MRHHPSCFPVRTSSIFLLILCVFCFFFVVAANLRRHMESIHSTESQQTCHICGRSFRSDAAIRKHLLVHTGEKPFGCDLCPKKFARNDKLKQHRNSHFGLKLYHCDVCEKTYTQRFNLIIHKRSHVGVDDVGLSCCCSIEFAYFKSFNSMNIQWDWFSFSSANSLCFCFCFFYAFLQSGEKPFHCLVCDKSFASQLRKNAHMKRHDIAPEFCWKLMVIPLDSHSGCNRLHTLDRNTESTEFHTTIQTMTRWLISDSNKIYTTAMIAYIVCG